MVIFFPNDEKISAIVKFISSMLDTEKEKKYFSVLEK